jgi:hypothetical protein
LTIQKGRNNAKIAKANSTAGVLGYRRKYSQSYCLKITVMTLQLREISVSVPPARSVRFMEGMPSSPSINGRRRGALRCVPEANAEVIKEAVAALKQSKL